MNKPPILKVVQRYLDLKKQGKNWWGNCPFHADKTPSFSIPEDEEFFYCFGCHSKGDVVDFVMQFKKVGFAEAVKELGIDGTLWQPDPELIRKRQEREAERVWVRDSILRVADRMRALVKINTKEARREWHVLDTLCDDLKEPEAYKQKGVFEQFMNVVLKGDKNEKRGDNRGSTSR